MSELEMRDVIVVGGGVAGLSCALRLQQAGLDVLLLEAYVLDTEPDSTDQGPTGNGNVVVLRWTIELIEEGSCDGC